MVRIPKLNPQQVAGIAQKLVETSKEAQRALPSSTGGETPLSLQNAVTKAYTHFTEPSLTSYLLYSAENWVTLKLELKTTGPVAWGTAADIVPVLGGKGILLETDEEVEVFLPKGTRVYLTSQTVNRVNVIIEPIPWLEQIDGDMNSKLDKVVNAVERMSATVVDAINALRSATAMREPTRELGRLPQPTRAFLPRLTK